MINYDRCCRQPGACPQPALSIGCTHYFAVNTRNPFSLEQRFQQLDRMFDISDLLLTGDFSLDS